MLYEITRYTVTVVDFWWQGLYYCNYVSVSSCVGGSVCGVGGMCVCVALCVGVGVCVWDTGWWQGLYCLCLCV